MNKTRVIAAGAVFLIAASNVSLIKMYNPNGTLPEINVQDKMLLDDEKKVIDYIYKSIQENPALQGGDELNADPLRHRFSEASMSSFLGKPPLLRRGGRHKEAGGKEFSVYALTNPFNINTTWSYLFEWYGEDKYGFVPVWGGETAEGFLGNIKVSDSYSELPMLRFVIIEPTRGIPPNLISSFKDKEDIFSEIVQEKNFGAFVVQMRLMRRNNI
jgi:hypothetical protein